MKILLMDDHVSFCEGLISTLTSRRKDYQIDFESNFELVPKALLEKNSYDLLVMDIMMPGLGGIELIRYLDQMKNSIPIVVLSSVEDPSCIREVFQLGVMGFIPKYYSADQIVAAIEQCRRGNRYLPAELRAALETDTGSAVPVPDRESPWCDQGLKLTRRQIEVISLMDLGFSNQQIASKLSLSLATIKTHINNLYAIFKVNNRVSCIRAAKRFKQPSVTSTRKDSSSLR